VVCAVLHQYRPRVGDVPLFPSPKDDSKPIRRDLTARWLLNAEKLAGLPKLAGGQFHPYRRLWATERKHLPIQDVAAAGGWKTVETVQRLYQLADGATTLAAVEGGK
jgi:integrase